MRHFYIVREDEHGCWIDEWNGVENTYQSIQNNRAAYIIEGNTLTPEDIEEAMISLMTNKIDAAIKNGTITLEKLDDFIAGGEK